MIYNDKQECCAQEECSKHEHQQHQKECCKTGKCSSEHHHHTHPNNEQHEFEAISELMKTLQSENEHFKKEIRLWQEKSASLTDKVRFLEIGQELKIKNTVRNFFMELLSPLDFLELARKNLEISKNNIPSSLSEGLNMLFKAFEKSFSNLDIHPIDTIGVKFDPKYHDMLTFEEGPAQNPEQNIGEIWILEVTRLGFRMKDQVLREASVYGLKVTQPYNQKK
jgi:molecular chaperone GrpE (heat shock protein)